MPTSQQLRRIFQDITVSGKFEKKEAKAVVSLLIDLADRVKKLERLNEVPERG